MSLIYKIQKITNFDTKMRQIKTVPSVSNLIYPQVCGICGRLNENSLCNKCEIELNNAKKEKIICDEKEIKNKNFDELIYIFKYEGLIRNLIIDYKFNEKAYLNKTFVNFLLKDKKIFEKIKNYDTIIPVPISKKRQKERGYNQSLLIAREISRKLQIELLTKNLVKIKNVIEQSKLNKEERIRNVQGVYKLKNKQLIKNKKILLVDDIYTTGNTVNECSKMLKIAKPNKIGILVLAKD